jgi:GMP synthase (glutamine-hydrolysing)
MRPVLIFTETDDRRTGLIGEGLQRAGCPIVEANPHDGVPQWSISELSAIVAMGGLKSAIDADGDPFMAAEVQLMRDALVSETPVLGFCLGAQLLAAASGGHVSRVGHMYLGWTQFSPLPAAADDPLFYGLPSGLPVLEWHEDMFSVAPDALMLGTTTGPGDALYRVGPAAWGCQAHIEVTPPMLLGSWLHADKAREEMLESGYEPAAFREECRDRLATQIASVRPVFERFGELVRARERDRDQDQAQAAC